MLTGLPAGSDVRVEFAGSAGRDERARTQRTARALPRSDNLVSDEPLSGGVFGRIIFDLFAQEQRCL